MFPAFQNKAEKAKLHQYRMHRNNTLAALCLQAGVFISFIGNLYTGYASGVEYVVNLQLANLIFSCSGIQGNQRNPQFERFPSVKPVFTQIGEDIFQIIC